MINRGKRILIAFDLNCCSKLMAQSIPCVLIPPPPRAFVDICHLVGPDCGEYVRKPQPGRVAFVEAFFNI